MVGAREEWSGEAWSGAAHLFDKDGNLLQTLHPTGQHSSHSKENYGVSVCVSEDHAIVSSDKDDANDPGGLDLGAVYIYGTPKNTN